MWSVVAVATVLIVAAAATVTLARRRQDDVAPTVEEFANFRATLSRQVAAVEAETRFASRHLDRRLREPRE